jgi:glycosyltransferase involved in cell wall biosynthesis
MRASQNKITGQPDAVTAGTIGGGLLVPRPAIALLSELPQLAGSGAAVEEPWDCSSHSDPIGAAARRGMKAGHGSAAPDPATLRHAAEIAAQKAAGNAEQRLVPLLALIWSYPRNERLQILAARLIDAQSNAVNSLRTWNGIHRRFPHVAEPFRMTLRWIAREGGLGEARKCLAVRFPSMPTTPADLLMYAWGQHELRDFSKADEAFERCLGTNENAYLQFSKSLVARGEIWRSRAVLQSGIATLGRRRKLISSLQEITDEIQALSNIVPNTEHGQISNVALAELFKRARARPPRPVRKRSVGRMVMITGSLGAGGAERQFAITAKALRKAAIENATVAGYPVNGPIEVYCRSLRAKPGADFFLSALEQDGIPVAEYSGLESAIHNKRSAVTPHADLLRFLPSAIAEGTIKLAERLRRQKPDIVQIWQDGSIYATGLSALMAGVPRIALNVRTLPPIDRPDRYKPEYELIFQTLLAAPNVILTANSRAAANRYAQWLSINPDDVAVIHNGVELTDCTLTKSEQDATDAFEASTRDADFTLGSIMRFDENKRPHLWLRVAAVLLQSAPRARFILVGDGPLWLAAQSYARSLGIADRILFVGRSHAIKSWLSRMDAFLLLSRFEGLPNVLVEAQQAGVPVCTTSAGGCAEAVLPGKTGLLLPSTDDLDPRFVAGQLQILKDDSRRRAMGREARIWATSAFSVSSMIDKTVASFMARRP